MRSKYLSITILVLMLAVMAIPTVSPAQTKFLRLPQARPDYYPRRVSQALSSKIEDLEVTAQTGNASLPTVT